MKHAFTIIELLIVLAVIAALISALVPIGIRAINEAKTLTVANNLYQISTAIMQHFYLNHEIVSNISDLNSYFGDQSKLLNKYALSRTNSSTLTTINIWYTGGDITASNVQKYSPSIVATQNNVPMIRVMLLKYW